MSEPIDQEFYNKYGICEACYLDQLGEDDHGCECWKYSAKYINFHKDGSITCSDKFEDKE